MALDLSTICIVDEPWQRSTKFLAIEFKIWSLKGRPVLQLADKLTFNQMFRRFFHHSDKVKRLFFHLWVFFLTFFLFEINFLVMYLTWEIKLKQINALSNVEKCFFTRKKLHLMINTKVVLTLLPSHAYKWIYLSRTVLGSNCKVWDLSLTLEVWDSYGGFIRSWALQYNS